MLKRAVIRPPSEDFVDRRVVDGWLSMRVLRDGQALPLHPSIEDRQDEVEEAMIAEFAPGSALGQGEVGTVPLSRETGLSPWEEGRDTQGVLRDPRYGL